MTLTELVLSFVAGAGLLMLAPLGVVIATDAADRAVQAW